MLKIARRMRKWHLSVDCLCEPISNESYTKGPTEGSFGNLWIFAMKFNSDEPVWFDQSISFMILLFSHRHCAEMVHCVENDLNNLQNKWFGQNIVLT